MAHIFISYSRQNQTFARRLAESLSAFGAEIWIDLHDIPAGMKWSSAIQEGLDRADLLIVVISPESMASKNVEDEWQYYLDNNKPIIPVLLVPSKIHFQLSRIQYIDFSKQNYDESLAQLHLELQNKGIRLNSLLNASKQIQPTTPHSHPLRQLISDNYNSGRKMFSWSSLVIIGVLILGVIALGINNLNPKPDLPPSSSLVPKREVIQPAATQTINPSNLYTVAPEREVIQPTATQTINPSNLYTVAPEREVIQPTATQTINPSNLYTISVKVALANLRTGPGVNYPLAGTALQNTHFTVLALSPGIGTNGATITWYRIQRMDPTESVWISSDAVTIVSTTTPLPQPGGQTPLGCIDGSC
jgi:hypothetical protein